MSDFIIMTLTEKKLQECEERFKNLFKSGLIPAYVFQKNKKNFILIDYNDAAENMIKGSLNQFLGIKGLEIFEDSPRILKDLKMCFKSETTIVREMKLKMQFTQEKKDFIVKYTYLPPDLIIVYTEDITERKNFELKLKESEFKFRSLFEAISDIYFLLSKDTTVLDYRGKKEELYTNPEQFMGKKLVDFLPSSLGVKAMEYIEKTNITKQPHNFEYELPIQNELHYYEARFFYLTEDRISCFIRDITERKKVEKNILDLAKFPSENPNPVFRVNMEKILYINQAGKNLFNTSEGGKIPALLDKVIKQVFNDFSSKTFEIGIDGQTFLFDIVPIQHENYVNIYGRDITEQINSENELRLEKKFTDNLINATNDTIFVFNPKNGKAIRWNKAFSEVSGYTDEEISSMKAPDSYYSKVDLKQAAEATKEVKKKGLTKVEISLISKNNESIPYEYSATLIEDSEGNLLIVSIGRDISERKKIELELKESEEKFRSITEQSLVGISVIQDSVFKYANDKFLEIHGYSREEMRDWNQKDQINLIYSEDRAFVVKQVLKKQVGDTDVVNQYKYRILRKDRAIRWIEIFSRTINYKDRPAILAMYFDITDKLKAEQELKDSEEKFRSITQQLLMGIFILQDNAIKYLNNKVCEIVGYSADEIKNWGSKELNGLSHPEDREFVMEQALKKQVGDTDVIEQYNYRIIRKDGQIRWLDISSKTINYNGRPADLAMLIDITEKVNAEQKLKESEEKFRNITEQSLMGISVIQDGLYKYFNQRVCENSGYSREEIENWGSYGFEKIIHPEDKEFVMEQGRKKQAGDLDVIPRYSYRIIRKDGEIRWMEISSKSIIYDGKTAILLMTYDITDKIKAEQELKESEEKFRTITEQSLMGISILQDHIYKYFNKRVCEMNGYSPEEMYSWKPNEWQKLIYPEDREFVAEEARKKESGDPNIVPHYQYRVITKEGEIRWHEVFSKTINYRGRPADLVMTFDNTERVKAEQELKESEEKFRNITEQSLVGISIIQEGKYKYFNKRFCEMSGYSEEEIKSWSTNEFSKVLHPEDREFVMDQVNKKQAGDKDIINHYRYKAIRKNGEVQWREIYSKTISYKEHPADLILSIDISDEVKAEQKLKESEERYRLISEASQAVIWTTDLDLNLTYLSPNTPQIFGATPEEVLSLPLSSIFPPDSLEKVKSIYEEELSIEMEEDKDLNRSRTYEVNQTHKNGSIIPIEITFTFLRDYQEQVTGILGVSRDISERKKAENQLKESEKKYREAYDIANFYKDLFTHDMNNILHIIGSSAEIIDLQLGESDKSAIIENITKMIHSQVVRGAKLISDVRTLTELDDAEIPINRVNITKFLKKSINFIEKSYSEKELSIFVKNLDKEYYTIGNELLQDVFDNILRNGIKHNENSDIQLSIKISTQKIKGKKNIRLEFIDNGIGIPEKRKMDIFQPSNRERKGSKGMGIGLSLVKKILTIFNGKIWVEDKIKGDYTQGSKFIVLLPEAN